MKSTKPIRISFDYVPNDPDDDDTGMSANEYEHVTNVLMSLGADEISFTKAPDDDG